MAMLLTALGCCLPNIATLLVRTTFCVDLTPLAFDWQGSLMSHEWLRATPMLHSPTFWMCNRNDANSLRRDLQYSLAAYSEGSTVSSGLL